MRTNYTGCLLQSVLFQQHANFHMFCPNSTKLGSYESWMMEILCQFHKVWEILICEAFHPISLKLDFSCFATIKLCRKNENVIFFQSMIGIFKISLVFAISYQFCMIVYKNFLRKCLSVISQSSTSLALLSSGEKSTIFKLKLVGDKWQYSENF